MNISQDHTVATGAPSHLTNRLEAGEQLIWWGRPDARKLTINSVGALLIAFTFAVLCLWKPGLALLQYHTFDTSHPISLIVGIAGLYGAYAMGRTILNRHKVAYGLTERRLIIATGRWKAKSFGAKAFRHMERKGTQRGTIWFDHDGETYSHSLVGIPDAEHVEQLLRQQFPVPEKDATKSIWQRLFPVNFWNGYR